MKNYFFLFVITILLSACMQDQAADLIPTYVDNTAENRVGIITEEVIQEGLSFEELETLLEAEGLKPIEQQIVLDVENASEASIKAILEPSKSESVANVLATIATPSTKSNQLARPVDVCAICQPWLDDINSWPTGGLHIMGFSIAGGSQTPPCTQKLVWYTTTQGANVLYPNSFISKIIFPHGGFHKVGAVLFSDFNGERCFALKTTQVFVF